MVKIITDGPIVSKVFENSDFSQNQKNSNLSNAEKMYNKVPNSMNGFSSNVGLAVGKVQSGKTANIITFSALALDNDHKLIIMLLSDTNNLLDQNYERISASFLDCEDVIVMKQSKDGNFASFDSDKLNKHYARGKKLIVCSLKHHQHIGNLCKVISGSDYKNDFSLIIDDEGDDVSQNTAKNKFFSEDDGNIIENERSKNNHEIVKLKNLFDKCGYISLTATPEAPLFLQTFQDLAPNFCVTLQPGIGYTGLLTFHHPESKHIIEIDDFNCLVKESGLPDSLMDAVSFFFAGCVYVLKTKGKRAIHSMMIHPSKTIVSQDNVYSKLSQRLKLIDKSLFRGENSGVDFFNKVKENYILISGNNEITYDDLKYIFNSFDIFSINSKAMEKDLNDKINSFPYNIIIGGDLLDRGITIPNLAVTYIIRDSKKGQVDTLLQRARWFGYKSNYIETCRVYMPKSLSEKYSEIIDTEESLWEFLEDCSNLDYDLRNSRFSMQINSEILNPTSQSKATFEFEYSSVSAIKQQKSFTLNNDFNNSNLVLVRKFDWNKSTIIDYNEIQRHRYLNVSLTEFSDFVDKFYFSEYNNQNGSLTKELLKKYVFENVDKYGGSVSFVDMRYENSEYRSVYEENCIRNLLQGRSEGKEINAKDYYPGDRYLPEMRNKISLQIHHVKLKISDSEYYQYGDEVIMLALCMPKDFTIKNFVKRSDVSELNRIY